MILIQCCLYLDGINFGGEDRQSSVLHGKNFHMIRGKHVITLCLSTGKSVWQKLLILLGTNKYIYFFLIQPIFFYIGVFLLFQMETVEVQKDFYRL